MRQKLLLLLMVFGVSFSVQSKAKTVLEDTVEIVTDPFKIGEGARTISESLDRTLLQLHQLQDKTDKDIRDYLVEIDQIVSSVNSTIKNEGERAERTLLELSNRVFELEKAVHRDALDLIWRAQCAAEVIATDTLQRALADAINSIRASEPSFKVFGIPAGKIDLKPVDIKDPDIAYRAVKKKRLHQLHNRLQANDYAYIIRSTYLNLARLSKLTQCHYIGQDSEVIFIRDYYEFERLSIPWNRVVHIED